MVSLAYGLDDYETFVQKALQWAIQYDDVCFLNSNGYRDKYGSIEVFLAAGASESFLADGNNTFKKLQGFIDRHPNTWVPGFLGYDLKNEIEPLESRHADQTELPDAYFFVPKFILLISQYHVEIKGPDPKTIYHEIIGTDVIDTPVCFEGHLQHRMTQSAYFHAFTALQQHIQQGDIYEVNLCQEFFSEGATLNPLGAYWKLNSLSPTPFSCFFKRGDKYILSASPERFLSKFGNTLLSQPIKGTAPRGNTSAEDQRLKEALRTNPKEVSENIMIVDLVRNDLTRSAEPGSVKAAELLEVYSFKQVHQLISTITCNLRAGIPATEAIRNTFPPGSMTGAPKISAMKLIDRYEHSRRGVYSGAVGYFSPHGDFDFNVVIRTMLYNAKSGYLSFHTGGAITGDSDPDKEYNECLLKGKALFEVLKG